MKRHLALLATVALIASGGYALADKYDLAYKNVGEFPVTTTAPASGDLKFIYVAADNKVESYSATAEKLTGTFNGTVGATTPASGAFTTITASSTAIITGALTASGGVDGILGGVTPAAATVTTLTESGNLAIATNKFTVAASSGNTIVAGTMGVTGALTASGGVDGVLGGVTPAAATTTALQANTSLKVNATNGTSITAIRFTSDAVANGQTAKTTTLTGVTSASKCTATVNTIPTNSVFLKAAAPGTDQVVVTASADPGASTLAYTLLCLN